MLPCELDNGSAHTTIGRRMLKWLQYAQYIVYKMPCTPLAGTQAMEGSITRVAGTAILDLTAGSFMGAKVTLRRRKCYVCADNLADGIILIRKPERIVLGIEPNELVPAEMISTLTIC